MSGGRPKPACSTPYESSKSANLSRFERRINSFSLDETSPTWSSSSKDSPITSSIQDSPPIVTEELHLSKDERRLLHTLELRSGNRYIRRRSKSAGERISGEQGKNLDNLNIVRSRKQIPTDKMSASEMAFVSQLVINNLPLLEAELGPNLANDVDIFIKCCDHIHLCLTKDEDRKLFLQLIPTKFRGRAALILDGIEYQTLNELKGILLTKLVNTKPYQVQLADLRSCRQFPGESLFSFGRRVMQLLKGCKASASKKHTSGLEAVNLDLEETAVFTFKSGILNPHHRFYLQNDPETSLEKIIRKAEQVEETEFQMLEMQRNHLNYRFPADQYPFGDIISPHSLQNSTTTTQPLAAISNTSLNSFIPPNFPSQTLGNFHLQNNQQHSSYTQSPSNYGSFTENIPNNRVNANSRLQSRGTKCGFCNRTNHTYAECRIRKSTPFCSQCKVYGHSASNCHKTNSRYQANVMGVSPLRKKCNFCQRNGHSVEECRAKQLWETNSASPTQNNKTQEN